MGQRLEPSPVADEVCSDIATRIRAAAAERPGHIALVEGDTRLTASDLAFQMDRIAAALAASGVRQGDVVASIGTASADHLMLYLGVTALGAAMAPLPGSAAPGAVAKMLANAAPRAVFTDDTAPELPEGWRAQDIAGILTEARDVDPVAPRRLDRDLLFDIIYSSGTTGDPKGIEHDIRFRDRQVERFARFEIDAEAIVLFATPLYSNTTLATLIPALAIGARVILTRKFDEARYLATAEAERATHTMLVPVQYRRLIEHPEFGKRDLSSFRVKLSTSAPLPPPLVSRLLYEWPGKMYNLYGMTEGGVSAVIDYAANPDRLTSVGRATTGAEIRIIDEDGKPLPAGEVGEIVGRSGTIMTGYRAAPAQTKAAVWRDANGRVFIRTGDMGRLDEEGYLTLLDRKKDMIISGGFNIFAADLEAVLAEHPAVADVAVIGVPSARWGETPVACIVRSEATAAPEEILDWANARLGRMQRLAEIAVLDELPRSSIGKVLKRELRALWPDIRAVETAR